MQVITVNDTLVTRYIFSFLISTNTLLIKMAASDKKASFVLNLLLFGLIGEQDPNMKPDDFQVNDSLLRLLKQRILILSHSSKLKRKACG